VEPDCSAGRADLKVHGLAPACNPQLPRTYYCRLWSRFEPGCELTMPASTPSTSPLLLAKPCRLRKRHQSVRKLTISRKPAMVRAPICEPGKWTARALSGSSGCIPLGVVMRMNLEANDRRDFQKACRTRNEPMWLASVHVGHVRMASGIFRHALLWGIIKLARPASNVASKGAAACLSL
jgi:hypothetical protein